MEGDEHKERKETEGGDGAEDPALSLSADKEEVDQGKEPASKKRRLIPDVTPPPDLSVYRRDLQVRWWRDLQYLDIPVVNDGSLCFWLRVIDIHNAWLCYVVDTLGGTKSDGEIPYGSGTLVFPRWIKSQPGEAPNWAQLDHEIGKWNRFTSAQRNDGTGFYNDNRLAIGAHLAEVGGSWMNLAMLRVIDLTRDYKAIQDYIFKK
jgi:hypothetical protein